MMNLGKLKEIKDLRKVWPHEALDFTPWLADEENLALLSDAIGLEILMWISMRQKPVQTEKLLLKTS